MKYRRALLLADLRADPAPALAALRRVAPAIEHILVVARIREAFGSIETSREPDAEHLAPLERWRAAAAKHAPTEVRYAPALSAAALADLAVTENIDLFVAGSRSLETAPLLARAARQVAVAVLWPAGDVGTESGARVFCAAIGDRARASIVEFLREHAEPSLDVAVVGPPTLPADDVAAALDVLGIRVRLDVLPRASIRAALEAALRTGPVDLIVLARLPMLMLLRYRWPAPVLLVPAAPPGGARVRILDITDVIETSGIIRARIGEIGAAGSLAPAADVPVAFISAGRLMTSAITTPSGEVEVAVGPEQTTLGIVRLVDDREPNALLAIDQRVALLRPTGRPMLLLDSEAPDDRLRAVGEIARTSGLEVLAVRLRPTRRAAAIRQRLQAAGLPTHVVDARAVLDEGEAHDIGESNDAVRLRRVAARLSRLGFVIASLLDRSAAAPESFSLSPAGAIAGNRIEVELDNVQARSWLLDSIAKSRETVHLQVYMAADDEVGQAVEAVLAGAAARGVAVRVLVDSLHGLHGSLGTHNPLLTRLGDRPGIELRVSSPVIGLPSLVDLKLRDHRKAVIVDGRVALVGGRNLSHEYYTGFEEEALTAATPWRKVPWLDAGARIEGPAVAQVAAAFLEAWTDAGGDAFSISAPPLAGSSSARVVVHRGLRDAHTLDAYLDLVEGAQSHIYAVNSFPLVLELQHALLRALRRGVKVRALAGHLTPTHGDTPFSGPWSSARTAATEFAHSRFDPIAMAGGEVYLFAHRGVPGWEAGLGVVSPHVHAKLMSVDGTRLAVGSANFDVTSSYWESELMLVVEDAAVAERCEQQLAALIAGSVRVDADDPAWRERARRRSWMRKWPGVLAG